ncbi:MAG: hypothetical protein P8183_14170, partial [Anaerolineae bacterium]
RDGGPAAITLKGEVNGRSQTFTYRDNQFRSSGGDDFIPRLWATRAIGHLLTEIRLRGEDPELVQSVVNLSIRYGIITPYTSYLIEEKDIFSQSGRNTIVDDAVAEGERMMEMPMAGEAVEEAAVSADMAAAEAPMALPTMAATPAPGVAASGEPAQAVAVEEMVQLVGSNSVNIWLWANRYWWSTITRSTRLCLALATPTLPCPNRPPAANRQLRQPLVGKWSLTQRPCPTHQPSARQTIILHSIGV